MALVTFTVTVQLPDAGIVPPARLSDVPPLVAVTVPPQVVAGEALGVFTRFAGYVSVKAAPVMAVSLVLVSVMVIAEEPFTSIVFGLKPLTAVGGAMPVAATIVSASLEIAAAVSVQLSLNRFCRSY